MATKSTKLKTAKSGSKNSAKSPAKKAAGTTTSKKKSPKAPLSKSISSFSLDQKPPQAEPIISNDEIAMRAYFIGERRQQMGWQGDSVSDWNDALQQLRAEALQKPLKKR